MKSEYLELYGTDYSVIVKDKDFIVLEGNSRFVAKEQKYKEVYRDSRWARR